MFFILLFPSLLFYYYITLYCISCQVYSIKNRSFFHFFFMAQDPLWERDTPGRFTHTEKIASEAASWPHTQDGDRSGRVYLSCVPSATPMPNIIPALTGSGIFSQKFFFSSVAIISVCVMI